MIRRFLTRILLVVLLGSCGYNWLQVRALQAQVEDLRARLGTPAPPQETAPASAARHVDRSRLALARSDWKAAMRELEQGAADLKRGAQPPKARPAPPARRRAALPDRPHLVTTLR